VCGPLHTPVTEPPKCLASWTAAAPTAPDAPLISTDCPGRRRALSRRKYSAVASASAAASAKLTTEGIGATAPASGRQTYSACAPNRGATVPKTGSPAPERVTAGPTDSTTPAKSEPRTGNRGRSGPNWTRA